MNIILLLPKKEIIWQLAIAVLLIVIGITYRLFPHPPNFTPVAAIAIFGGVYLSSRIALSLPIVIMALSDMLIGSYELNLMIFVYISFILSVALGFFVKRYKNWASIAGSSVLSAVLFFIITNFAVWAFTPWYSKDFSGIIQCYYMALPFLKNNIAGNLFYTGILFGLFEVARVFVKNFLKLKSSQKFNSDFFSNN